jgi:hypothetical protein
MTKNLELGDRVDRWLDNKSTVDGTDVISAVNQEIVRFRPLAIDGISLILSRRTSGFEKSGSQRHDAGL